MTARIKSHVKKSGIAIAIVSMLSGGFKAYSTYGELQLKVENEKTLRERNERYFSDYEDSVECRLSQIKCNN